MKSTHNRPIHAIACDIQADWLKPYFGAVPYIQAMRQLNTITDNYFNEPAEMIVRYFLGNASTWRGETAKQIKSELKQLLKS